jgi:hypothetical protein
MIAKRRPSPGLMMSRRNLLQSRTGLLGEFYLWSSMSRGRSMPKGSSILRKSSMARKSSMPKIIPQDAFVMSVYKGSLYVGEGSAKEGKPGVEKVKQLFKLINAYFPSKICLKGL